jgi:phage repressor protein C with HTH and peptisase S24 domain
MDPELKNGATALVNPHLPPKQGETCVFRTTGGDSDGMAIVGVLTGFDNHTWRVHQYKPRKNLHLKRSEWPLCHTIVGNYSRR